MAKPITPLISVDIIIELKDQPGRPIVLIERKYTPFGWALPGGFVDVGERIEQAAIREALEETSLHVHLLALLGVYSDPQRDPRGHTISPVFIAEASGQPQAADDAKNILVQPFNQVNDDLVFDHALILADYRQFRINGTPTPLRS